MTKSDFNQQNQAASPEITKVDRSSTTTTEAWSMSEENYCSLMMSIKSLTETVELVQKDIAYIKTSQDTLNEKFALIESDIGKIETSCESMRESPLCEKIKDDLNAIKKNTLSLDQELRNDRLIIRNLPLEICGNKSSIHSAIQKVFTAINLNIKDTHYDAFSTKSTEKKSANIVIKLSSSMQKSAIIRKYRQSKQQRSSLLVSKIFNLPESHSLSGKLIVIANKLTSSNAQLMENARKYVPSHFNFVYDTPDSKIMVNIGNEFHKIENNEDIVTLIGVIDENRQRQKLVEEIKQMIKEKLQN